MENFNFWAPTYFAFGQGQAVLTGELVRHFGGSRVLLHYGGGSIKRNGAYEAVTASLQAAGLYYAELGGVEPNPKSGLVYEGIDLCRREGIDLILAVGGGSVIDSAKAIAMGVGYDGDFWDLFSGKAQIERVLPLGTVLTLPAAGSEGSPNCVITHENGSLKWGTPPSDAVRPRFSVLDPSYTLTLSPYQTACGITDMMAHICERYFTNTKDVEVTDRLCEGLLKSIIGNAIKLVQSPDDYAARADIMWAGMLAHNNICGVGREQDWASHNIEHEISSYNDCAHGAGLAVIMPSWMEYVVEHDPARFARFAVNVWGCEPHFSDPLRTANEGILRFRAFLHIIGMPSTLAQLGIGAEAIPGVIDHRRVRGFPMGNFVKLYDEDMQKILEIALNGGK